MAETNPATNVKEPKPLSFALKTFFGVGDMTFTLMTSVETYYFNFFLTDIAKFAPAVTIFITSTASMIDMALSWIYGAFLSALPAKKWGRYRSWLVMVPWIVPFLYAFQFLKLGNDATASIIIIIAAVTSHILWNTAYVANVTLISVVGKTPEGKAAMSSTRAAYTGLSGLFFSYIFLGISTVAASVVGKTNVYAACAFVFGCIFCLGYFLHFKLTDGYEDDETSAAAAAIAQKNKVNVVDMFKALFQNGQLLVVIVAYTAWAVNNFMLSASAVYFWRVSNAASLQAVFITGTAITGFLGSLFFRPLAVKVSSRTAMIIGCFGNAICFASFYFLYANPIAVLVMAIIGKFFMNISYSAFPVLFSDTIVYATWKTGKNAAGWIMGLMNLPVKIGIFLRGIILTSALTAVGYSAKLTAAQYTPALRQGIAAIFGLLPGALVLLCGLMILFMFKLTKEKVAEYQAEIDKRA